MRRALDRLGRRASVLFLTPCVSVIGNNSEELFFGLLKARREGRRLVIARPFELPWKFRFPLTNREIFGLASPHILDLNPAADFLLRLLLTAIYGPPWIVSKLMGKLTGRPLPGRFTHPDIGVEHLWKPEDSSRFRWSDVESRRWAEEIASPLQVGLKPARRALAHEARLAMGIPENAWFAGLHVRESGFYGDAGHYSCRNATIANYLPAIREITANGGWVVRLGDRSMTPLPRLDRVVDYPHTAFKSDLMDLYLLSECRFYIGMSSGILDTALLFQRPTILMNMTNMTFVYPRRPGDRGIPKHVYSKSAKRFLSARELLEAPWEAQHFLTLGADYEMFENSPEELREVVTEFLGILEGNDPAPTDLQAEANRLRVEHGRRLLDRPLFDDPRYDVSHRYRIASRLDSALGSLSRSFLEKNWLQSSRNAASVEK